MPEESGFEYWRNPTEGEIKFGYGCIHYGYFKPDECLKTDGTPKKWLKYDGLRYNFGRKLR